MIKNRSKWLKVSLASFIILFGCAAGFYFYHQWKAIHIFNFYYEHDAQAVNKIFEENRYWLLQEGLDDYSLDHLLINRVSNLSPDQYEKETIKVLYYKNDLAGFITYYKSKFWQGRIRLLAVDKDYRGHGFGLRLLQYAMNDLIAKGCTNIFLVTRTTNYPAQKIYKKAGFKETDVNDGFVRFDYYVQ